MTTILTTDKCTPHVLETECINLYGDGACCMTVTAVDTPVNPLLLDPT